MKKLESWGIGVLLLSCVNTAKAQVRINVDGNEQVAKVSKLFNGTNIEDLNNQTNGGVFSQLLHGEAFEENMDVDFLNLKREDYSKIYVMLDERRIPHLLTQSDIYVPLEWNNLEEKYDFNSIDVYNAIPLKKPDTLSNWCFNTRFIVFDSLPANIRRTMLERLNGNEQISRYWAKGVSGSPIFRYELVRDGKAYMGRQTQRITFVDGKGEVGLSNQGLYKQGICLEKGKSYDGMLRIKTLKPVTVYLSFRNEKGDILAEKPYRLEGNGEYRKVEFELKPSESTKKGSFCIALKEPGEVDLGFAFLQPGEWGRVKGCPFRKMFVDALKKEGISVIRYNGSMVDRGPDHYLYRWKKMLLPVDERRVVFRSGFNTYATHSFGIVEMLKLAEVVGAEAIIGMSWDETSEDISDFVEYVNGPVTSEWGRKRAEDGHPQPYNLKYIQVHNERPLTKGYVECMKKFAFAAWKVDPEMTVMTSVNIKMGIRPGSPEYELAKELVAWFMAQGKADKLAWDSHYDGSIEFADSDDRFKNIIGINLQNNLAKDFPGFKLNLHPMEENGDRCDWDRGLAHAHNWNTLQRYGNCFKMLGTANTFQPHGLHYMWDQGRIHYSADTIWFQPSAYVDQMIMQTWKPIVLRTDCSDESKLDVTAKLNEEGNELSLYVVNLTNELVKADINLTGLSGFKKTADVGMIGNCDLTEYNTPDDMERVAPKYETVNLKKRNMRYSFPRYSYTVITMKK